MNESAFLRQYHLGLRHDLRVGTEVIDTILFSICKNSFITVYSMQYYKLSNVPFKWGPVSSSILDNYAGDKLVGLVNDAIKYQDHPAPKEVVESVLKFCGPVFNQDLCS